MNREDFNKNEQKVYISRDDITKLNDELDGVLDVILDGTEEKSKNLKDKVLNFKDKVVNKIKNPDLRIVGAVAGTVCGIIFHTWLKNRSKTQFTVSIEEIRNKDFNIYANDGEEAVDIIMKKYLKGKLTLSKKDIGSKMISITSPEGEVTSWGEF